MTDAFWNDFTTNSHVDSNPWFDGSYLDSQIYPQTGDSGVFHEVQSAADLENSAPNFSTEILNPQFTKDIVNFEGADLNAIEGDDSRDQNDDVCFGMVCVSLGLKSQQYIEANLSLY